MQMSHRALKLPDTVKNRRLPKKVAKLSKVRKLCDAPHALADKQSAKTEPYELALRNREAARKLALSMIGKWKCRIEPQELQSVIDLALCEAASRYNHAHGAAFMTFLYYHLKGKLIKTIAARADQSLMFIDDYEKSRLEVYGDDETSEVRSSEWRTYSSSLGTTSAPEEALYRQQLVDICYKACLRLKGVERDVIWQIYFENKDLSDLTQALGYSRGHLFRVRTRALEKIKRVVNTRL